MIDYRGIYAKFVVTRTDGDSAKHPDCEYFVLDLTHDPAAPAALAAYAEAVAETRPQLSADLKARLSDS